MANAIIKAENIAKYFNYGKKKLRAVDHISLEIEEGTTLGLVGESGSGKSTVARLILNLISPTDGKVEFMGKSVYDMSPSEMREARQNMQIIFQNPYLSLFPQLCIGDNIMEPFIVNKEKYGNLSRKEREEKVYELMKLVGVPKEYYNAFPHELSGGQQQRVGIARALALDPKLIICDEPVSSLDVSIQAQILNLLQDLQEKKGLSYLFIAHNLAVVEHISKRIAVMYLGKIVECADTDELYNNPKHPYTKALLAAVPVITADSDKEFTSISGEIPSPLNPPSGCRFCTRCEYAMEKCYTEEPEYKDIGNNHYCACHLIDSNIG